MVGIETIVIVWMDDTRLPKQIFYFSLKKRHLKSGGKKKRFKDVFKKWHEEIYRHQQLRIQCNGEEYLVICCQRLNKNIRIENIKRPRVKENTLKRKTTTKALSTMRNNMSSNLKNLSNIGRISRISPQTRMTEADRTRISFSTSRYNHEQHARIYIFFNIFSVLEIYLDQRLYLCCQ